MLHALCLLSQLFIKKTPVTTDNSKKMLFFVPAFARQWPRSLMDRASDYGSEGWGFESLRGHIDNQTLTNILWVSFFCLARFTPGFEKLTCNRPLSLFGVEINEGNSPFVD